MDDVAGQRGWADGDEGCQADLDGWMAGWLTLLVSADGLEQMAMIASSKTAMAQDGYERRKDEKSPEQVLSQMATKTAIPVMTIRSVCVERSNGCNGLMDVIMKTMLQTGCEKRDER